MAIKHESSACSIYGMDPVFRRDAAPKNTCMSNRCSRKETIYDGDDCFHTTVVLELPDYCLQVTSVLFDTGAAATFASRRLVNTAGLVTRKASPRYFELADGPEIMHDEVVTLPLWIAGVYNEVRAYVDDGGSNRNILFGGDAVRIFRSQFNAAMGNWTVSQNVTGLRRLRLVVEKDGPYSKPTLHWMGKEEGIKWSEDHGLTTEETKAKPRRERYEEPRLGFKASRSNYY